MTIQLNNNTVNNASNAIATPTNNQPTQSSDNEAKTTDDIQLSTRAQKIQRLNQEFFPNGPGSLKITPDFIQRLQEYGFINTSEAASLGASLKESRSTPNTIDTLSNNITNIIDRVKTENSDAPVISLLERSNAILSNLDGSNPSELARDIRSVNAELINVLDGDTRNSFSIEEQNTLEELSIALSVADRLNPANLSTASLNRYLSFI